MIGKPTKKTKDNGNALLTPPAGGLVKTIQYRYTKPTIKMAEQMVEIILEVLTIPVPGRVRSNLNNLKFPYSRGVPESLDFERRSINLVISERKDGFTITRMITTAKNPQPGFCIKVESTASINQILVPNVDLCQRAGASFVPTYWPWFIAGLDNYLIRKSLVEFNFQTFSG